MPKVYLSPPYHKWNPCAISGCDETTHNNQYLDELEPFLKACKIDYKRGTRRVPKSAEDGTELMNDAIAESNAYRPDIHYVSHTNAYDGTVKGCRPMIFPLNNAKGERLAEIMIKHRKKIYSSPISLVRTDRWAELKETVAVAYYEEHVFHDNKEDAKWFHDHMRDLARVTAQAFCEYFGIAYVEPYPEKPKEQESVVNNTSIIAVYDLNFPEKNLIVDNNIRRTEIDCVKAIKKILYNNSVFDVEIAKVFWKLAPKYNIDPMMAIAQSVLETGWFKYAGSAVKAEQHNYCGLGVTSNGVDGNKFDTIEDGVTAQLQHLFAYGSKDALCETIIDPRFKYVTRGIAPYWQQLAGRWACPGYDKNTYDTPEKAMAANNTYGQKIRTIYNQLIGVTVTDADVEKHFPKEMPDEKPEEKPIVDTPATDIVDTPVSEKSTSKIVDVIIQVIKKLFEALVEILRKGTK